MPSQPTLSSAGHVLTAGDEYYNIICVDAEAQTEVVQPKVHLPQQCNVALQTDDNIVCGNLHDHARLVHAIEPVPLLNVDEDDGVPSSGWWSQVTPYELPLQLCWDEVKANMTATEYRCWQARFYSCHNAPEY